MIKKILNRVMAGISFGGLATFISLTVLNFAHIEVPVSEIWKHSSGSFILGIYFAVSSFIFEIEKWSSLKQTMIHYTLSIIIYFLLALPLGWIPMHVLSIIIGILAFSAIYGSYWTGFYLYFKRVEASLNEQLQRKE